MCNKVATPSDREVKKSSPKFDVQPFDEVYHADGFTRPFLPFTGSDTPYKVSTAQWKLIPHWVNDEAGAKAYSNTLNAVSEEIFTKPSYRSYIGSNRGLLWVKGFYEPHHPTAKVTVPYYIYAADDALITMGCVYADWLNKDTGEVTRTFSIITTAANDLMGRIHAKKRMPLILLPEERQLWLGELSKADLAGMMQPLADGYLKAHRVSNMIYKRGVNANVPEAMKEV